MEYVVLSFYKWLILSIIWIPHANKHLSSTNPPKSIEKDTRAGGYLNKRKTSECIMQSPDKKTLEI